jgi:hypothetical protein
MPAETLSASSKDWPTRAVFKATDPRLYSDCLDRGGRMGGRYRLRPPSRRPGALRRRRLITAITGTILLATCMAGCGGTESGARAALSDFRTVVHDNGSADEVLREYGALKKYPRNSFSDEDWAVRNQLGARADAGLLRSATTIVDAAVARQATELHQQAEQVASGALLSNVQPKFAQDLREVTEEMMVNVGCGAILDRMAPEERPDEAGLAGLQAEATTPQAEALVKLVARSWNRLSVIRIVNWAYYTNAVIEGATRYASALSDADPPQLYLNVSRPPVQRALAVYLRTCYRPPKQLSAG